MLSAILRREWDSLIANFGIYDALGWYIGFDSEKSSEMSGMGGDCGFCWMTYSKKAPFGEGK